jgi:hypothetical protein
MTRSPESSGGSGFPRLALAHATSVGADTLIAVALAGSIFFSVPAASARPKVLLYLAVTMVPFALVAPVMGPALDRTRGGRRLMVGLSAAGRGILCLLMARHLHSLLFYPEAFGSLALSKGHLVAKSALVPAMVADKTALVEANSRLALIAVLAGVVVAPLAAGLSALAGAAWVLRAAALVNAAGVVTAFRIPRAERTAPPPPPREQAELRAATVRLAATGMAALRAAVGFLTFLVAFSLKRQGAPSWLFAAVIAAGAVGNLIGAAGAPWLRQRVREETILVASLLVPSVITFLAGRRFGPVSLSGVAAAVSAGAGAGRLAFDSLVQRDAPEAARGRTFARFETRFQLAWVAGAVVPVAVPLPGRLGLVGLAVGMGFAGLFYLAAGRSARRGTRTRT